MKKPRRAGSPRPQFDGTKTKIDEILQDAREHVLDRIEYNFAYGASLCESPIERLFISQMLHPSVAGEFDTTVEIMSPQSALVAHCEPPPLPGIYIYPQIKIGDYRVDFYLAAVTYGEVKTLIVECDGHDFHEKTKEQAQRDKARDRFLVAQGYRLLRFTGSEIYADPLECVIEALTVLHGLK